MYRFDNKNISEHLQIYLFKTNLNISEQYELLHEDAGPCLNKGTGPGLHEGVGPGYA